MIQIFLAMAGSLPGLARVAPADRADGEAGPAVSDSSAAASEAGSGDQRGADDGYCDITLPVILERRLRENDGQ